MAVPEHERKRILAIAQNVRRWIDDECGGPWGVCSDASYKVHLELRKAKIQHQVVCGNFLGPVDVPVVPRGKFKGIRTSDEGPTGHCWIQFPQWDAILDVTADQFASEAPHVWFPAPKQLYEAEELIYAPLQERLNPLRRPLTAAKVHVRRHLKHPPRYCLCHRSKAVDRARRGMVRRLR